MGDAQIFEVFRYQLLPRDGRGQLALRYPARSVEGVRDAKNSNFELALKELLEAGVVSRDRPTIKTRTLRKDGRLFVFKMARHRTLSRTTGDFEKESIDDWPHVRVWLLNEPAEQLVLVQRNTNAFSTATEAVNKLRDAIEVRLAEHSLTMHCEPLFDQADFWDLVEDERNAIEAVTFRLISPNMSNISKSLTVDLHRLHRETATDVSQLELRAAKGSELELRRDSTFMQPLVEYASQGGGGVKVKIRGLRKATPVGSSPRTVELTEAELEGDPEVVAQLLKTLIT